MHNDANTTVTERLRLRSWSASDEADFIRLGADPDVMEFFPSTLTAAESLASVQRYRDHLDEHGFGIWVVEEKSSRRFLGIAGLQHVRFEAAFTPAIELGYRFDTAAWNQGFATEASKGIIDFAFRTLGIDRIVAFTATINARSRRVMEKVGMHRVEGGDFDHPAVEPGHVLRRHVLYETQRDRR